METKQRSGCTTIKAISEFVDGRKMCIKCRQKQERHRQTKKYHETRKKTRKHYQDTSIVNKLYEYKKGADKRHLCWYLSNEYAEELFSGDCHYCGISSCERLNGIDRKDNDVGYVPANCLSCCSTCNYSKRDMKYEDFIDLCRRISKNFEHMVVKNNTRGILTRVLFLERIASQPV